MHFMQRRGRGNDPPARREGVDAALQLEAAAKHRGWAVFVPRTHSKRVIPNADAIVQSLPRRLARFAYTRPRHRRDPARLHTPLSGQYRQPYLQCRSLLEEIS